MSGQRLLAVFVALAAVAVVVLVVWLIWFRPLRTVVRPVVTTPIVASPTTPLPRDSIRESKRKKRSRGGSTSSRARNIPGNNRAAKRRGATPNKPRSRTRRRLPARTTPDRHRPSQGSQQPAQPSNPPSTSPQPRPPVDVTVPAPVTVCVRGVGGANCP